MLQRKVGAERRAQIGNDPDPIGTNLIESLLAKIEFNFDFLVILQ